MTAACEELRLKSRSSITTFAFANTRCCIQLGGPHIVLQAHLPLVPESLTCLNEPGAELRHSRLLTAEMRSINANITTEVQPTKSNHVGRIYVARLRIHTQPCGPF